MHLCCTFSRKQPICSLVHDASLWHVCKEREEAHHQYCSSLCVRSKSHHDPEAKVKALDFSLTRIWAWGEEEEEQRVKLLMHPLCLPPNLVFHVHHDAGDADDAVQLSRPGRAGGRAGRQAGTQARRASHSERNVALHVRR